MKAFYVRTLMIPGITGVRGWCRRMSRLGFSIFVLLATGWLPAASLAANSPAERLSSDERPEQWALSIAQETSVPSGLPTGGADPRSLSEPMALPAPLTEPAPLFRPSIVDIDNAFPATAAPAWEWQLLPKGVLYHTYWASAAEPRMSVNAVDINGNSGPYINSSIGGRVPIVRFGSRDMTEGWQFDILGGAKLRQNAGDDWDVVTVDFRYDLLLTHAIGPHRWKFGFYHVSAHLGDEYMLKHPTEPRLNFLRDTLVMGYSYYALPELRLYGEVGYAFNYDISRPLEFQFGFDYGPAGKTGPYGAPFIAMNGHLREELDYGGNFALQAGWAWRSDGMNTGTFRTGLYYYDGKSPQFSFYNRYERQVGWGIWYDY